MLNSPQNISSIDEEKISDRVRRVIAANTSDKGRPLTLENEVGLNTETWKKFLAGKQRASLSILQAVSRKWPEYALWMTTGIVDHRFGHIDSSQHRLGISYSTASLRAQTLNKPVWQYYDLARHIQTFLEFSHLFGNGDVSDIKPFIPGLLKLLQQAEDECRSKNLNLDISGLVQYLKDIQTENNQNPILQRHKWAPGDLLVAAPRI